VKVVGDSVIGINDQNGERFAVLGSQVVVAETRHFDPVKTTMLAFTSF
jgi:hypothetical protein